MIFTDLVASIPEFLDLRQSLPHRFLLASLGVAEEYGELCGEFKKAWRVGQPIDKDRVLSEAGDLYYYLAYATYFTGAKIEIYSHIKGPSEELYETLAWLSKAVSDLAINLYYLIDRATIDGWRAEIAMNVVRTLTVLDSVLRLMGLSPEQAMQANYDKRMQRAARWREVNHAEEQ